jgi:2-haloacid dehalogenase
VSAAGVCFPDLLLLRGEYQMRLEPPFIPGMEVAGVVRSAPYESAFNPGPAAMNRFRALAFDVFGTVVDWRSSIIRELEEFGQRHGLQQDWPSFADNWRAGYAPAMDRVRRGELAWTRIDDLHRMILDDLLVGAGIVSVSDGEIDELNRAWHRLDPWPDTLPGLTRLKEKFTITTLSNGNMSLLIDMAKRAGLPWDCVISAELFHHYKPDRQAYLGCADLLGVPPDQLMLVAAHPGDLRAARAAGLRTAFVARPLEHGPGREARRIATDEFDFAATDFVDLAEQLGA